MNALKFTDKQIMDLSQSKPTHLTTAAATAAAKNSNDFLDLMNHPQSEEEETDDLNLYNNGRSSPLMNKKGDILPNYDFYPIQRPVVAPATSVVQSLSSHPPPTASATRAWNSMDSKSNSSPLKSYNSLDHVEPDNIILEKALKVNDSSISSEIDRTMKRYIDSVLHAIDGLSARLSQLESKTRHLEHSVDELKVSVGNNHGSADGKLRQLENILLEVQTGVQDMKDKQDVMEGHMQLAKLHISKVDQSSEFSNAIHSDPVQQTAASAPPQQSGTHQYSFAASQQAPLQPNLHPPSLQNAHLPLGTTQYPPGHTQPGPQRDAYLSSPSQTQEVLSQQYQIPPPAQHQQQPPTFAQPPQQPPTLAQPPQQPPPLAQPSQQPQQYQSTHTPPYPQPSQPPPQKHPGVVGPNASQFLPSFGHRPEEGQYMSSSQTYPPNLHQPASQPSSTPHSQPYYGSPSSMYDSPSTRPSSGVLSPYVTPSVPGESYPYGGPASHYVRGSSVKGQPHSSVGSSNNYPPLPTARILPQTITPAAEISGGSSAGGSGNKVPIDDVIDKVTNMGFPRDHVRATVRKLTENGQSVDLNVVLDKLMNDGDVQPLRGWLGR